jgi:endonuclease/exonuclease/phosphatase family metal-dependent hydrolase
MSDQKISVLLALSLISSPIVLPASTPAYNPVKTATSTISSKTMSSSQRASTRRMKHLLAATPVLQSLSAQISEPVAAPLQDYIHPSLANHIDAPLPQVTTSDQVVGIYGNILYPQDKEQIQQEKLTAWIEAYSKDSNTPFPLSPEDLNDISLYILDRFPSAITHRYFATQVRAALSAGSSLENALEKAREETLIRAALYKEIASNIPAWKGRCEVLTVKLIECADQIEKIIDRDTKMIRANPAEALQQTSSDLIEPPFTWDMRTQVFKQMIDKVVSTSPNSPYFLALQEVTPQALSDLKKTFADRDLQWISFNNMSGKETLSPGQEEILGEATGFTSTLALSRDLEILKVELGDLPTESGSIRKILGVRVRNTHTNETFNLFSTHTDHKIQNDIYARTAAKIHEFATRFFSDAPTEQRFVIGGDLNAFQESGGDKYIERLRELFTGSQDFRETDYYAPNPIAWSSFIGRYDDTYSGCIAKDGIVEPSALDHIIVGNGVELQSAGREAGVYNDSGRLLDYYKERDEYLANLQRRITFSDHFFNIIRFK